MSAAKTNRWCAALAALALLPAAPATGSPDARAPRRRLAATADPALVRVEQGWLRGAREGGAVAFRGVPFAAPPGGGLRWSPPVPPAAWSGARDASAYAPPCPQLDDGGHLLGSEDCLYLNVFRPAEGGGEPLPVLFFIHGGGHVQGSTSVPLPGGQALYDGGALAVSTRAVVVTAAYRLGALGFLAHPALAAASPDGVAGNYGTRDLAAALAWVARNAAAFGGDPARVLAFGESAGAVQTCMLLASPLAAGLFSAALMESGACAADARADAEALAGEVAANVGCGGAADVAACLRAQPTEALVRAVPADVGVLTPGRGYASVVDGVVLPEPPLERIAGGRHNRVPLVVGANRDETGQAAPLLMTEAQYRAAVIAQVGSAPVADLILARYPSAEYGSPRAAYVAMTSDANFICGARRVARAAAAGQGGGVFRYLFTRALAGGSPLLLTWGAYHGLELFFVFDKFTAAGYTALPEEAALAAAVRGYWRHLAAAGTPADPALPFWPEYEPLADRSLDLGLPIAPVDGVRTAQCDFWDALLR